MEAEAPEQKTKSFILYVLSTAMQTILVDIYNNTYDVKISRMLTNRNNTALNAPRRGSKEKVQGLAHG